MFKNITLKRKRTLLAVFNDVTTDKKNQQIWKNYLSLAENTIFQSLYLHRSIQKYHRTKDQVLDIISSLVTKDTFKNLSAT